MAMPFYSILLDVVCPSGVVISRNCLRHSAMTYGQKETIKNRVSSFPLRIFSFALISSFSSLCQLKKLFQFTKKPFQFTLVLPRTPRSRPMDLPHHLVSFPFNCWVPFHLQREQLIQNKSLHHRLLIMGFICPFPEKFEFLVPPFKTSIQKCIITCVLLFCAPLSIESFSGWQEHLMSLLVQEYLSHLVWNALSSSASKPSSWKCLWAGPGIPSHQPHSHKPGSYSLLCRDRYEQAVRHTAKYC